MSSVGHAPKGSLHRLVSLCSRQQVTNRKWLINLSPVAPIAVPLQVPPFRIFQANAAVIVKTANPWKAGGVQDPSEKLFKTVKGVLNKLTPDNYEKLFNQIISAGISDADMLRGVISLVSEV
jgi:hypothetical protein